MSVDDWARREARAEFDDNDYQAHVERRAAEWGIVHAFSALLSDEAVEAAARGWSNAPFPSKASITKARIALQTAIDAVTKEARP